MPSLQTRRATVLPSGTLGGRTRRHAPLVAPASAMRAAAADERSCDEWSAEVWVQLQRLRRLRERLVRARRDVPERIVICSAES